MNWVRDQIDAVLPQLALLFGHLVQQIKEWQPLLASLLILLASIILTMGLVKAARIRGSGNYGPAADLESEDKKTRIDMRAVEPPAAASEVSAQLATDLESLRSLLRSALASLSSVDTNHEAARLLCSRIASLQGRYTNALLDADKRVQETSATLLGQFESLRNILSKDWSASEISAILIQLNASARALFAALEKSPPAQSASFGHSARTNEFSPST